MNFRSIQAIYTAPEVMMGSIKLRQAFPLADLDQVSPFILLHHFDFTIEPGHNTFNVPPHPHRGFCPITYMFDGSVMHKDSLGNEKEIHSNEVQWIQASRGIIHSETMSDEFVQHGGRFQGIQLWINLLASEKMKAPSYLPITKDEMVLIEQEGVICRLVSGELLGKRGPATSSSTTAMLSMLQHAVFNFQTSETDNLLVYVLEGEIKVNEQATISQHQFVHFNHEDELVQIQSSMDAKLLLMSGEPIHEPLVTHGPFVMNSQTEILEAMKDYQQGKMGFLY